MANISEPSAKNPKAANERLAKEIETVANKQEPNLSLLGKSLCAENDPGRGSISTGYLPVAKDS